MKTVALSLAVLVVLLVAQEALCRPRRRFGQRRGGGRRDGLRGQGRPPKRQICAVSGTGDEDCQSPCPTGSTCEVSDRPKFDILREENITVSECTLTECGADGSCPEGTTCRTHNETQYCVPRGRRFNSCHRQLCELLWEVEMDDDEDEDDDDDSFEGGFGFGRGGFGGDRFGRDRFGRDRFGDDDDDDDRDGDDDNDEGQDGGLGGGMLPQRRFMGFRRRLP